MEVSQTPSGPKINGLIFTGVYLNGRLIVISDHLPVKAKNGRKVHNFEMPEEKDPLSGEVLHTIVMSQEMYDALMSDAEEERNKVESLSSR